MGRETEPLEPLQLSAPDQRVINRVNRYGNLLIASFGSFSVSRHTVVENGTVQVIDAPVSIAQLAGYIGNKARRAKELYRPDTDAQVNGLYLENLPEVRKASYLSGAQERVLILDNLSRNKILHPTDENMLCYQAIITNVIRIFHDDFAEIARSYREVEINPDGNLNGRATQTRPSAQICYSELAL